MLRGAARLCYGQMASRHQMAGESPSGGAAASADTAHTVSRQLNEVRDVYAQLG